MTIIDKLTQSRAKAKQEIHKMARQEAEGASVDANKAAAALTAAGLTEADYGEAVSFFEHVIKLEAKAVKRDEATKAHGEAKAALAEHERETKEIIERRRAEFARLMEQHQTAEARSRQAKQAENELAALRFKHPERFGAAPVENLDNYTLTHGPSVIGSRDPQVPTLEVDAETFRRESARRGRISANARERANAERRKLPLDWRGIVERGLVKELDG